MEPSAEIPARPLSARRVLKYAVLAAVIILVGGAYLMAAVLIFFLLIAGW